MSTLHQPWESGSALDRYVAQRLGLGKGFSDWDAWWSGFHSAAGEFSSDLACAWRIVETMRERGWDFEMRISRDYATGVDVWFTRAGCVGSGHSGSTPLAICRAALEALDT